MRDIFAHVDLQWNATGGLLTSTTMCSVNMADEIEIKLTVSDEALKAVPKLRWLKAMLQGKSQRKELRSVYFDTGKGKLKESGLTLRVRHVGKRRLQTVKADRTGMFTRHEWECEIAGNKPDLSVLPPEVRERLGQLSSLRPVFETTVTRTTIPVLCNGTELELALDFGVIKAGRRRAPISEIEIELKRGDPVGLVTLAERLAGEIDVSFEVRAKSERGYALATGELGRFAQARDVDFDATMTAAEAFRAIAMECLRHLSCNETAVLGGDACGVRQMRVGLRRLRAAMSIFRTFLTDSQSQNIRAELEWLKDQLGSGRDFDALARARNAVENERYRHLILGVALWLANGAWGSHEDLMQRARRDRPILQFVAETLDARTNKVSRRVRKLKSLTSRECHELRTAIRKLRCIVAFFAPLYDGRKAKRRREKMSASLEALQKALGRFNDRPVRPTAATDIVANDASRISDGPNKVYALGVIMGPAVGEHLRFLAVARKAGERLKGQKTFWR